MCRAQRSSLTTISSGPKSVAAAKTSELPRVRDAARSGVAGRAGARAVASLRAPSERLLGQSRRSSPNPDPARANLQPDGGREDLRRRKPPKTATGRRNAPKEHAFISRIPIQFPSQTYASNSAVTRYAYDGAGQRVRKVFGSLAWTEAVPPVGEDPGTAGFWTFTKVKETVYLPGGYEVVRNLNTSGTVLNVWQMLSVMDDRACVARIETKTVGYTGSPPAPVWRYQLANHLGSSCLEVSDSGSVVSREEYYAYGGTAYARQASGGFLGSVKRYRYSGKECDYFEARYYAAWIGRWTAGDPTFHPGKSTYEFCNCAPTSHVDLDGRDPKLPSISVGRTWTPLDTIRSWNRLDAKDSMSPKTSLLHKIGSAGRLALGVVAETIANGLNETRVRTAESGQLLARATIHAQRGQYNAAVEDASFAAGGFAVGFLELAQNFVGASSKGGAITKHVERAGAPLGKFANALKDKVKLAFSTAGREAPTVTRGVDSTSGSEFVDDALRMVEQPLGLSEDAIAAAYQGMRGAVVTRCVISSRRD